SSQCFFLFIKNLFLRRKLRVKRIGPYQNLLICGARSRVHWSVEGCYKILLGEELIIPGNVKGIELDVTCFPLDLKFFGIGDFKQVHLAPRIIELQSNIVPPTSITVPRLRETA